MTIRKLTVAAAIAVGIATCSFNTVMAACPCDQRPIVSQSNCGCNELPTVTGAACPCDPKPTPCCDMPKCEPDPVPSCALCPNTSGFDRENMKQVYAYPNGIYGYNNYVGTRADSVYSSEGFGVYRDDKKMLTQQVMGTTIAQDEQITGAASHFSAVAEAVDLPIILYNIPSRTGVNMLPETVKTLARKYENIVAIKQSFGDMDAVTELKSVCPHDFTIYSGDDSLTLPMLALGAHGVISVASHLFGKEIKSMIRNFKTGDAMTAKNMHLKLYPIFKKLFMAPNPVPVKAALAYKEIIEDYVRRPLVELTPAEKSELIFTLDAI